MNKIAKLNQFNRSGNVYYRVEQREDGQSAVTLSVDFERAPEPDHSYIADYFEVHRTEADIMMVFGKLNFPSETELRNKVEIYFPFQPFMQQFWKSSRKMRRALTEAFEKAGKAARAPGNVNSPDVKVQTLVANNALVVIGATQCMMDFFLIAAKDLWLKTKKGDPLNVNAIVRVYMSEQILLGLLNRCDEFAQTLKAELELPGLEDDDEVLESLEF